MTDPLVTLEVTDGVGLLLLNRPPVNALNEQLRDQLVERSLEARARNVVGYLPSWSARGASGPSMTPRACS